jgi:hypothetical protein
MAYHLTREELVDRLREQLRFLERSGEAYDEGYHDEAKRLAVVIRVLLHDTNSSRSVLGLLGVKDQLKFTDTAGEIEPENLLSTPGLVMFRMGGGEAEYVPPLDDLTPPRQNPPRPFDEWWTMHVTKDANGNLFARKDYVLSVANKEGGAHVDPQLDPRGLVSPATTPLAGRR